MPTHLSCQAWPIILYLQTIVAPGPCCHSVYHELNTGVNVISPVPHDGLAPHTCLFASFCILLIASLCASSISPFLILSSSTFSLIPFLACSISFCLSTI